MSGGARGMRIIDVDPVPVAQIAYTRASRADRAEHVLLDFLAVHVDRLPDDLDAIIVTADLQGYDTDGRAHPRLLGEAVAEKAAELAMDGRIGPPTASESSSPATIGRTPI